MKILISLCLLALFLSGCKNDNKPIAEISPDHTTTFDGEAMTMSYKIVIGQILDQQQVDNITAVISATFNDVNSIFNKWNPASEISQLNRLAAGEKKQISEPLQRLFKETDLVVTLSENRFDPTIEPLQRLWKEKLNQGQRPSQEELKELSPAIGWKNVHLDNGIFYKDHHLTQLDFGGIAKGLAIDIIIEQLQNLGYSNLFVEWGGEIRATGQHPQKRPWTIYISRLGDERPTQAIATLFLKDQAIATSGDYLQNWSYRPPSDSEGSVITYFHIFDPHTLQPLEASYTSIASASVLAPNCVFADGLATTAMMFPSTMEAEEWAQTIKEKYPNISFWLVSRQQADK